MRAPFVGRMPVPGDKVYIDFGDSYDDHPEIDGGIVSHISDEFISVAYGPSMHTHKRFRIANCVHIEVLD